LAQVASNRERPLTFAVIVDIDGTYDRQTHTEQMLVSASVCTLAGRDHPTKDSSRPAHQP
jgi:hypothetical protein